jgi:hypothetical protein
VTPARKRVALLKYDLRARLGGMRKLVLGPRAPQLQSLPAVFAQHSGVTEPRLNLMIPTIDPARAYGGIATALEFFRALSPHYQRLRLVSFSDDFVNRRRGILQHYPEYRFGGLADDGAASKEIVSLVNARGDLAVGPCDIFVATYWSTAYVSRRLASWRAARYGVPPTPIVYLIQDYEPYFYAWSSEHLLALETYRQRATVAVYNTALLQEYCHRQNHHYDHEYSFEASMNPLLRERLAELSGRPKNRTILIYGRPSVPRNAFALITEGLRVWYERFPEAARWKVVSAGEIHPDIRLGKDLAIHSLGKLSLDEYARVLAETGIGISFMVSPHPSYPPLEMAHYGVAVLTNGYANKNLSSWHENIRSLEDLSPEGIAAELGALCGRVAGDPLSGWRAASHVPHYLSDEPTFPFAREIRDVLQGYESGAVPFSEAGQPQAFEIGTPCEGWRNGKCSIEIRTGSGRSSEAAIPSTG